MKILRMFFDPIFDKKESTNTNSNNSNSASVPKQQNPIVGEYIDYEEIK